MNAFCKIELQHLHYILHFRSLVRQDGCRCWRSIFPHLSFSSRPHVLPQLLQCSSGSGHVVLLQWWVPDPLGLHVHHLHLHFMQHRLVVYSTLCCISRMAKMCVLSCRVQGGRREPGGGFGCSWTEQEGQGSSHLVHWRSLHQIVLVTTDLLF